MRCKLPEVVDVGVGAIIDAALVSPKDVLVVVNELENVIGVVILCFTDISGVVVIEREDVTDEVDFTSAHYIKSIVYFNCKNILTVIIFDLNSLIKHLNLHEN